MLSAHDRTIGGPMKDRTAPALFGIVVYDGVEPIDIGGTVGVISMARRVLPAIQSVTIAEKAWPVVLAGGLTMLAQAGFADAPPCDVVIVTGGPGWRRETTNAAMLDFLRNPPSASVTSVCTGAMILGAAGLLDGRMATTRRSAVGSETLSPLAELASFAPGLQGHAAAIVDDGTVVTGGGVSLAIDATLYLIGTVYGDAARADVAGVIEYDRAYEANRLALGHVRAERTVLA
jgi:transcriptional regulator GlxA family with amidase domain